MLLFLAAFFKQKQLLEKELASIY